jgi:hypothetical protein
MSNISNTFLQAIFTAHGESSACVSNVGLQEVERHAAKAGAEG